MRVSFEKVSIKATRRWIENGKRRQETQEFWQTISPFNLKTREEILAEIKAERDAWLKTERKP